MSIGFEEAVTDGNLVTGSAWTAHVEWLKQFLAVLNACAESEDAASERV